ncbi:hypothetical protein DFH09DRAFT_812526, partial [Mycena vulgaris]
QVDPFEAGPHYGPVLDPLQIRALHITLRLNPLLQPPTAPGARTQLVWNMLFPSNKCSRSGDPVHMPWGNGRHEPVTFPRVTCIRLVSEAFPWVISVPARDPDVGVTCGDLVDYIARDMARFVTQGEYQALPRIQKDALVRAYRHNRSHADGVPGDKLDRAMLRLDWLGRHTIFGGVRENDILVKHVCGDSLPCTFELVCIPQDRMLDEFPWNQPERDNSKGTKDSTSA